MSTPDDDALTDMELNDLRELLRRYLLVHPGQQTHSLLFADREIIIRQNEGMKSEIAAMSAKMRTDEDEMRYALALMEATVKSPHACRHPGEPCPYDAMRSFLQEHGRT